MGAHVSILRLTADDDIVYGFRIRSKPGQSRKASRQNSIVAENKTNDHRWDSHVVQSNIAGQDCRVPSAVRYNDGNIGRRSTTSNGFNRSHRNSSTAQLNGSRLSHAANASRRTSEMHQDSYFNDRRHSSQWTNYDPFNQDDFTHSFLGQSRDSMPSSQRNSVPFTPPSELFPFGQTSLEAGTVLTTHFFPGQRTSSIRDQFRDSIPDSRRTSQRNSVPFTPLCDLYPCRRPSVRFPVDGHCWNFDARLDAFAESCLDLQVHKVIAEAMQGEAALEVREEMAKHKILCEKIVQVEGILTEVKKRKDVLEGCRGREKGFMEKALKAMGKRKESESLESLREVEEPLRSALGGAGGERKVNGNEESMSEEHTKDRRTAFTGESETNIQDFEESILDREDEVLQQHIGKDLDLGKSEKEWLVVGQILNPSYFQTLVRRLEQNSKLRPLQLHDCLIRLLNEARAEIHLLKTELNEIRSDLEIGLLRMSGESRPKGLMDQALIERRQSILERQEEQWASVVEMAGLEAKPWPGNVCQEEVIESVGLVEVVERPRRPRWYRLDSLFSKS